MKLSRKLAVFITLACGIAIVLPLGHAKEIKLNESPEAAKVEADKDFDRVTSGKDETTVKSFGSSVNSLIVRNYESGFAKSAGRSLASGILVPPLFAGRGLLEGSKIGWNIGANIGPFGTGGDRGILPLAILLGIVGALVGLAVGTVWGLRIGLEGLFSGGIDEEDSSWPRK